MKDRPLVYHEAVWAASGTQQNKGAPNVSFWHKANMPTHTADVRSWGQSGHAGGIG
jgi:hypothetical protein